MYTWRNISTTKSCCSTIGGFLCVDFHCVDFLWCQMMPVQRTQRHPQSEWLGFRGAKLSQTTKQVDVKLSKSCIERPVVSESENCFLQTKCFVFFWAPTNNNLDIVTVFTNTYFCGPYAYHFKSIIKLF